MNKNSLGKKIRECRESRQISCEELALNANLNKEEIEKIETKGVVPSLGHLIKISRALGVKIGMFLDDQDKIGPVIVKAGEEKSNLCFTTKNSTSREHLNFFSLARHKAGRHMEPFVVEIEPSKEPDYKLSSHEGEEFIYVLEGSVEINYGKNIFQINKGDTIYLDSVVPHNVHAGANQFAKILTVIYTPA